MKPENQTALTRRVFLGAAGALSYSRIVRANDRVRVGVLGAGGRGTYVARLAREHGDIEIAALADVYEPRLDQSRETLNAGADVYGDFRAVLDRKDIDAVIIGSPDHWHVPMTVAAVEAGKDVYVEKPLTHSVSEGRAVIDAVRKSGRVVQVGYQQRSWPHFRQAGELVRGGALGKITQVLTWWNQDYKGRQTPRVEAARLDWPRFLGSACPRDFDPVRKATWRWFWDYGGGTLTDLFSHWIDSVHWIMGESVPLEVRAHGEKLYLEHLEAPDTVNASWFYPKNKFLVSYVSTMVTRLAGGGIIFRGTDGSARLTRDLLEVYPGGAKLDPRSDMPAADVQAASQRDGTIDHVLNWLDCVRTKKQPNSTVADAVDAANAAHWGNEALRSGRALTLPAPESEWRELFNGRNLDGWTPHASGIWTARSGMIVGKHTGRDKNDFLRTREHFEDFELSLEFRLLNGAGNSGVQFRSGPAAVAHEVSGYQADIGARYWGSLYDESRRNRVLAQAPGPAIDRLDKDGWHTYVVRAFGNHITLTLDGMRTVDYTESEPGIPKRGMIALQVHSGPGIEVWFRNIRVRALYA